MGGRWLGLPGTTGAAGEPRGLVLLAAETEHYRRLARAEGVGRGGESAPRVLEIGADLGCCTSALAKVPIVGRAARLGTALTQQLMAALAQAAAIGGVGWAVVGVDLAPTSVLAARLRWSGAAPLRASARSAHPFSRPGGRRCMPEDTTRWNGCTEGGGSARGGGGVMADYGGRLQFEVLDVLQVPPRCLSLRRLMARHRRPGARGRLAPWTNCVAGPVRAATRSPTTPSSSISTGTARSRRCAGGSTTARPTATCCGWSQGLLQPQD